MLFLAVIITFFPAFTAIIHTLSISWFIIPAVVRTSKIFLLAVLEALSVVPALSNHKIISLRQEGNFVHPGAVSQALMS